MGPVLWGGCAGVGASCCMRSPRTLSVAWGGLQKGAGGCGVRPHPEGHKARKCPPPTPLLPSGPIGEKVFSPLWAQPGEWGPCLWPPPAATLDICTGGGGGKSSCSPPWGGHVACGGVCSLHTWGTPAPLGVFVSTLGAERTEPDPWGAPLPPPNNVPVCPCQGSVCLHLPTGVVAVLAQPGVGLSLWVVPVSPPPKPWPFGAASLRDSPSPSPCPGAGRGRWERCHPTPPPIIILLPPFVGSSFMSVH